MASYTLYIALWDACFFLPSNETTSFQCTTDCLQRLEKNSDERWKGESKPPAHRSELNVGQYQVIQLRDYCNNCQCMLRLDMHFTLYFFSSNRICAPFTMHTRARTHNVLVDFALHGAHYFFWVVSWYNNVILWSRSQYEAAEHESLFMLHIVNRFIDEI